MAERYVSGGSVDWTRLAETLVATLVLSVSAVYIGIIELLGSGLSYALGALAGFYDRLIGTVLGIPVSIAGAAGESLLGFTVLFGPFSFPVAVVMMIAAGFILYRAIEVSIAIGRGALS